MDTNRATAGDERQSAVQPDEEQRWQAVLTRDRSADGSFYYAVVSTGVYCRPSCASRRPRRENVRFYDTCGEAEQAGFRACKRCRPDQATLTERHAAAITAACRMIETADTPPGVDALAGAVGMSRFHFQRVFKELTGITPRAYAAAHRGGRARRALAQGSSVTEALYDAGFNSSGRFYEAAPALLGMTPTAYRDGGTGLGIRFALGECWLGTVLVAATDKGVCAISLGDEPDVLLRELQQRFPKAQLIGGDADFERSIAEVIGFLQAPERGLELPLDIRGTAFQQRVWQALREIPSGSTANYADIARRIGQPAATRAVARACAANPLAVAIPCHRVIRTDGSLSGYRWGVERKQALLEREASE
ncbi:MAG: bifunctional DNA-binding transcriptional regulator/O6-methylguanine-DNA methyltransferase Ada [Acidihalobacter sp.]|uniref:bifunctional DNA-binding transcriptional regulator/O6-methylguanine-DNA methyltransferase Ada n=1 Tax=Acidihalobacter sp. TaxID=1872108 RepID=UPI00307E0E06